jgi:hypothetical protein
MADARREPLKRLAINTVTVNVDLAPPVEHNPITEQDVAEHLLYAHALKKRKKQHPESVTDGELVEGEVRSLQVIIGANLVGNNWNEIFRCLENYVVRNFHQFGLFRPCVP